MPVYYVRDCGLLHAKLGIDTTNKLRESKAAGHSWESFSIEAIINTASDNMTPAFYRDKGKNEIDLVLNFSTGEIFAIEIKLSETADAKNGFAVGCNEIGATKKFVVHSGERDKPSRDGVSKLSLISTLKALPL